MKHSCDVTTNFISSDSGWFVFAGALVLILFMFVIAKKCPRALSLRFSLFASLFRVTDYSTSVLLFSPRGLEVV